MDTILSGHRRPDRQRRLAITDYIGGQLYSHRECTGIWYEWIYN